MAIALNVGSSQFGLLLALAAVFCGGCAAECFHLPDDVAYALSHCHVVQGIDDFCNALDSCATGACGAHCGSGCVDGCGCGVGVSGDVVWLDGPPEDCSDPCCDSSGEYGLDSECCADSLRHRRVQPGPPPVSYEPPMPPKFLPVPARSVFSQHEVAYPHASAGGVEVGYGSQLAFPAGDR